jgi:quercetin dioxygenase-like cupin family protein
MSLEVGLLFSEPDVALVRRDSAPVINLGGSGVDERLMTPRQQSRVQLVRTNAAPRATGGSELYTINCALEVVYVVKGTVDLVFSHGHQRLTPGDALTFPGGEPHTWENVSSTRPAELLWLMLPAPWSGSD